MYSFKRPHIRTQRLCFSILAVTLLCGVSQPTAYASEKPVARPALVHLARQLVDTVDYNFERANNYLDTVHGRENFKAIPDGEILLMQIAVGGNKGLIFNQPVLGIKQGDDVMLSMFDFVSVAQFSIDVKPAEKIAEGWYIRENKKFKLDANTMKIKAEERTYDLSADEVIVEESDILVKSSVLAKVLEFQGDVSLRYQKLDIQTGTQKWPAIEKLERLRRRKNELLPPPSLPRQPDPYEMASVPSVDISTNYEYAREGAGGIISKTRGHSAVFTGDLANHTMRAVVSGDKVHAVQAINARLTKESDEPNLLGRLKAREYEIGDANSASIPGAMGKRGGVGARVTNRNPYRTTDETTVIEGDIAPGWDVELYQGNQYLDVITAADGRYRFEDVRLAGGENNFRIIKYGPLGQVEEEEISIYSAPEVLAKTPNIYDVSVNASDTVLWTRQSSDDQDKYTPIINASLEHRLTQDTSIKGGVSTSQQDGQQKTFIHGGGATYIDGTILNAGLTADADGSLQGSATARRNIFDQQITLGASFIGDNYGSLSDQSSVSSYTLDFLSRGSLPDVFDYSLGNYSFSTKYNEDANHVSDQTSILSLSNRLAGLVIGNKFTHTINSRPGSQTTQNLEGQTTVNGRLWGLRWRAAALYSIDPETHINQYFLDVSKKLSRDWQVQTAFSNTPDTDFTQGEARLIWTNDRITLAPGIRYNTDNDFSAFVTANFGLAYDQHTNKIAMSGKKITDTGGISGFVYLDKDGDMAFSEGDEPIQDAVVEALHSNRKGNTDEEGEAFIHNIPDNILTDVSLNELSLFDPLMVSATKGRSVLPRSGHTTRLEFPVHNGGELDGNVYVLMKDGKDRSAKNLRIHLHEMNGDLVQTANVSFDGFYLFQKIHPGEYWLSVDYKDAGNQQLIRPLPQKVSFGYEGTVIYGHKISLRKADKDQHDVPSTIGEDYTGWLAANASVDVNKIRNNLVINFGDFRSRALMNVMLYKLKMFNAGLIRDAELLVPVSQNNPDSQTGLHSLRAVIPGMTMEHAWDRCYRIIARGVDCKIEMLPTGLDKNPGASPDMQAALDAKRWGG